MALFLADEDFDHRIALRLRTLGHDILTLAVLGLAGRRLPDEQVLATATVEKRAILTLNRLHFVRLHRRMPQHALVAPFATPYSSGACSVSSGSSFNFPF